MADSSAGRRPRFRSLVSSLLQKDDRAQSQWAPFDLHRLLDGDSFARGGRP